MPQPNGTRRRRRDSPLDRIYFDGHCGLCHRSVRFALARDRDGRRFRFTPLQSDRFKSAVAAGPVLSDRSSPPDSIVVVTAAGAVLTRSDGVLHILTQLGGIWRLVAAAARVIPRPVRDGAYDFIARIRYRLFPRPPDMCPIVPPHLRDRFEE